MINVEIEEKERDEFIINEAYVILWNINIGGEGSLAFPGPNNFPLAHSINSSYLKLFFFVIEIN